MAHPSHSSLPSSSSPIQLLPAISTKVKVFSRNSEDRTSSFPDVCARIKQAAGEERLGGALAAGLAAEVAAAAAAAEERGGGAGGSGGRAGEAAARRGAGEVVEEGGSGSGVAEAEAGGAAEGGREVAASGQKGREELLGGRSLVVDAEVVAVERDGEGRVVRLRSFQELSTRARGKVEEHEVRQCMCIPGGEGELCMRVMCECECMCACVCEREKEDG